MARVFRIGTVSCGCAKCAARPSLITAVAAAPSLADAIVVHRQSLTPEEREARLLAALAVGRSDVIAPAPVVRLAVAAIPPPDLSAALRAKE